MRLLRLTTLYPAYVEGFYAARPRLRDASYREQKEALDLDAFSWSDSMSVALAPLGYECFDARVDAEPLQRAWAVENGMTFPEAGWMLELAFAQVRAFSPEVLFIDDHVAFPRGWIEAVRAGVPGIRLVLGWCGSSYSDASVFHAYDVVLSCIPELVERFRAMGHRAEHLHHAFDARILSRLGGGGHADIPVSFVGQFAPGGYHRQRVELFERLARTVPVAIFSPMPTHTPSRLMVRRVAYAATRALRAIGLPGGVIRRVPLAGRAIDLDAWPRPTCSARLRRSLLPAVYGLDMYRTLRDSRVTLNCHTDLSPRSASNMRMFEATGAGACLVTDRKENLAELFEPDRELVAYGSPEECVERVTWLLEHPERAAEIARAGQARTLSSHRFCDRAARLDGIISDRLGTS